MTGLRTASHRALRSPPAFVEEDAGPAVAEISAALADLRAAGLLSPDRWATPADALRVLRRTAAGNLPLGRLLEGHVNAHRLLAAHAGAEALSGAEAQMRAGALYGVWGADGAVPVTWDGRRLHGAKRYASGLGCVAQALIVAGSDAGKRLILAPAQDPARQRPEEWTMAGMGDSLSGGFNCEGLAGQEIGAPDCYLEEPLFLGGTWRIAAVTLGGIAGLLDRAAADLRHRDFLKAEAHLMRLAPIGMRVLAGGQGIAAAAELAEGPAGRAAPERAATLSLSMRLLTEELAQDAIAAVERSIGLTMFETADPTGRMARDLACYIRQVARDAFTRKVGLALLGAEKSVEGWLDE